MQSGLGQLKYFCACKNKIGLNCQAVAGVHGHFLDVSIAYGKSTSDCLAFEGPTLFNKLIAGMLAEGC